MIAINCTHCKQRLEMDEAFAGGVCRCQHCGTIQTVPSHLKKTAAAAASGNGKPAQSASASHDGSGLDELADVVASSSGLARSTLRKKPRAATRTAAAAAVAPAAAATVDYASGEPHAGKSPLVPV